MRLIGDGNQPVEGEDVGESHHNPIVPPRHRLAGFDRLRALPWSWSSRFRRRNQEQSEQDVVQFVSGVRDVSDREPIRRSPDGQRHFTSLFIQERQRAKGASESGGLIQRLLRVVDSALGVGHMGAWSHLPFGNDSACDWIDELRSSNDLTQIEAALDVVLATGAEHYLEVDEGSVAIGACEVIAKLLGRGGTQSDGYTEDVESWIAEHPLKPDAALRGKALAAIQRILVDGSSELADLWAESGTAAWAENLAALRAQLTDEATP